MVEKLRELRALQVCTDNSTIPHLLQHEFPIKLSTVICNDKHLFELTTYFINTLVAYIRTNDCHEYLSTIAKVLSNHLKTFTTHSSLAPYQLSYINRLVSEVLKICESHTEILTDWLSEVTFSTTTASGVCRHRVSLLPIQQIIENFLTNELETFKTANWENFIKLSQNSPELSDYLCSQQISVFDEMIKLYFFPSQEYQLLHISVLEPVLSAVITIMENSSTPVGSHYFGKFVTMFRKHLNLRGSHTDDSVVFILHTLLNLGATTTLNRLVDDFHFQLYLNDKLQDHQSLETFLYVLSKILYKQDQGFLKLLSTKNRTQMLIHNSNFMHYLRIKVKKIHNDDAEQVSHRFTDILTQYSSSLEPYIVDTHSALIFQYFKLLLQYFQNKPSLDTSLNQLSLMMFLKFNMHHNATFIEVVNYLIVSYELYHHHMKLYEMYQYDPIESLKIVAQCVTPPDSEILSYYGVENLAKCINYVALPLQLELCKQLITDLYICCKLKPDG